MSAGVSCVVGLYWLGMRAEVSVVSFVWAGDECGGVCMWCQCVWAGDECKGVCVVGVYGLGMSAGVFVLSVCMGWG